MNVYHYTEPASISHCWYFSLLWVKHSGHVYLDLIPSFEVNWAQSWILFVTFWLAEANWVIDSLEPSGSVRTGFPPSSHTFSLRIPFFHTKYHCYWRFCSVCAWHQKYCCDGGCGFILACKDFGRMFDPSCPACSFFFSSFFKVEISWLSLIPLFMPGSVHSGLTSWDDCGWMFPDKLHVSLFLDRFPHNAWTAASSAHSDFVGSRVWACLDVTCHLHFLQNGWGLLRATAVTWGWNRHWIRVSTQT